MLVVLIVTQLEPAGAQRAAALVTAGLRERGYDADTWFLYSKSLGYAQLQPGPAILSHKARGTGGVIRLSWLLVKRLRHRQPGAVISFTQYANTIGQSAALLAGVPRRVASQRGPVTYYTRLARWADFILGSCGVYTANVMVSQSTRDSFSGYPRCYLNRSLVVHNGLENAPSRMSQLQARERFDLPRESALAISVGRLGRQKNHRVLLEVLRRLPSLELAIAGEGELRAELELRARALGVAERLHLLGEIMPTEVGDFLAAGDVFLLPSYYEGMSNALLEAMAAGLPLVVSDVPAQREVCTLEDGALAAVFIAPDDVAGWAEAVAVVMQSPGQRSHLAELARRRVQDFGLAAMLDGFERSLGQRPMQGWPRVLR